MHGRIIKTTILAIAILLPLNVTVTNAQVADFLNISVSANEAALGGAGNALSNGITAGYFNPAGLSLVDRSGVNFMHNLWYQDISYEYLGSAFAMGERSTISLSAAYLHMGGIEAYNALNQSEGTINPYSMAGIISYGRSINNNLSIGLSAKYINENLDEVSANGYAFDIGAQYMLGSLSLGLVANNIGPQIKYETDSFSLPTSVSAGASYSFFQFPLTVYAGAKFPTEGKSSFATGVEYELTDHLSVRSGFGGLGTDNASQAYNLGAGFDVAGIDIDYAFNPGGDMGQTHFFSFTVNFGNPRTASFESKSAPLPIEQPVKVSQTQVKEEPVQQEAAKPSIAESVYIVSVGNFEDERSALRQIDALKQFGIKGRLETLSDNSYIVTIAKTKNQDKAEKISQEAGSKGFSCVVFTQ